MFLIHILILLYLHSGNNSVTSRLLRSRLAIIDNEEKFPSSSHLRKGLLESYTILGPTVASVNIESAFSAQPFSRNESNIEFPSGLHSRIEFEDIFLSVFILSFSYTYRLYLSSSYLKKASELLSGDHFCDLIIPFSLIT
ncbi:hypothetical protein ACFLSY_11270 [Bacteroidota bacterium]